MPHTSRRLHNAVAYDTSLSASRVGSRELVVWLVHCTIRIMLWSRGLLVKQDTAEEDGAENPKCSKNWAKEKMVEGGERTSCPSKSTKRRAKKKKSGVKRYYWGALSFTTTTDLLVKWSLRRWKLKPEPLLWMRDRCRVFRGLKLKLKHWKFRCYTP